MFGIDLKLLFIAGGGALGAVSRHLVNISPLARIFDHFPFPTFFINIVGSFLIGFFMILLAYKVQISDNLRFAIIVGFLGAFTTFSTFEMEIYGLLKDRFFATAFLYLFLSVAVGFAGLVAGVELAKRF